MIFFSRSSNSPRYLVPATSEPTSSVSRRLPASVSGTSPAMMRLGQSFDDGGLANAWLADEGGVVLRAPREDLDDALDLLLAPDDRVELAGARCGRQVHAHLVDGRRLGVLGRRWLAVRAAGLAEHLDGLGAHLFQVDAQALQHAGGDAFALADQAQQQVLGADVVVVQATRLVHRQLDHLLGARRQANLARARCGRRDR